MGASVLKSHARAAKSKVICREGVWWRGPIKKVYAARACACALKREPACKLVYALKTFHDCRLWIDMWKRHYPRYHGVFHVIYQTRATVFHRDIQTPRRELKIRRAAEYFWRNSRYLDSRWNTVSNVWYIFSTETKTKARSKRRT